MTTYLMSTTWTPGLTDTARGALKSFARLETTYPSILRIFKESCLPNCEGRPRGQFADTGTSQPRSFQAPGPAAFSPFMNHLPAASAELNNLFSKANSPHRTAEANDSSLSYSLRYTPSVIDFLPDP